MNEPFCSVGQILSISVVRKRNAAGDGYEPLTRGTLVIRWDDVDPLTEDQLASMLFNIEVVK